MRILWLLGLVGFLVACDRAQLPDAPLNPDAPANTSADPSGIRVSPLAPFMLEIGRRVDGDGRVLGETRQFQRGDSVHLSVLTEGSSPASLLRVRWLATDGRALHADERAVTTQGPSVHTFRLTPGSGWPGGRYRVEVMADGDLVGGRDFDWPQ